MNTNIARLKQSSFLTALLGLLLLAGALGQARAGLPFSIGGEKLPSLAPMLEKATPAVVNIHASSTVQVYQNPLLSDPFFQHFFGTPNRPRKREQQNLGSGVIIDARKGYILTNNHVIEGADEIRVTLRDGRRFEAKMVGTDPDSDIAVLRIEADDLSALRVADSDKLRVGDFVIAIGNPFGLGQTVTSGIVSALGRSGLGIEGYEDFIQTDASINPGNSGGALVNLNGELIGINTAILSRSGGNIGIGFAIPINMASSIMEQLIDTGAVQRGRLGASAQDLSRDLAQAFGIRGHVEGAVVVRVTPGSPADKGGLRVGDVVVKANGRPVRGSDDLRNIIGLLRVGTRVELDILRDNRKKSITAVIEVSKQLKFGGDQIHRRLAGAIFGDISEDHPLSGRVEGVLVLEVERGSPASRTGLREGDIILGMNGEQVTNQQDMQNAAGRGSGIRLNVRRGNGTVFLMIN